MTDYKALVKRGHDYANQLADSTHIQHKGAELVGDLADAVEALVERVDDLLVIQDAMRKERNTTLCEVEAERDTLRAQLDGMTESVEYGVLVGTWPDPFEHYQTAELAKWYAARPFNGREQYAHVAVERRTLRGPWVEVTD